MPTKRSSKPIIWGDDLVLTSPPAHCRRRNQQIERQEQTAYFECIDYDLGCGKPGAEMIFAVPNETGFGGRGGAKVGLDRKRAGRRPGVPDICVAVSAGPYHGLYIEMKRPDGKPSDVSAAQSDWHERLRRQGYRVEVCYGWQVAYDVTASYLGWDDISKAKARARALAQEDSDGA